jgi:hypothetical protein
VGVKVGKVTQPSKQLVARVIGDDGEEVVVPFKYFPSKYSLKVERKVFNVGHTGLALTVALICEYLDSWELLWDAPKPGGKEGETVEEMVPLTLNAIEKADVPRTLLNAIMKAINEDQIPPKDQNGNSDSSF